MSPLKPLYALAIALLVVAFVGFGISAFYQEPQYPDYPSGLEGPEREFSPEEKQEVQEYREKRRAYEEAYSDYNLVVACISVSIAVLLLVGSVIRMWSCPLLAMARRLERSSCCSTG